MTSLAQQLLMELLCAGFTAGPFASAPHGAGWIGLVSSSDILSENCSAISLVGARIRIVYFEKIRVFNAGFIAANILAWNNKIGLRHRW